MLPLVSRDGTARQAREDEAPGVIGVPPSTSAEACGPHAERLLPYEDDVHPLAQAVDEPQTRGPCDGGACQDAFADAAGPQ